MRNLFASRIPFVRIFAGIATASVLLYIGLLAVVMSYAAMQVAFAEQVHNDAATVARLEAAYLATVDTLTTVNYTALGYTTPSTKQYVDESLETALMTH
jgi:hypothetical protein